MRRVGQQQNTAGRRSSRDALYHRQPDKPVQRRRVLRQVCEPDSEIVHSIAGVSPFVRRR
ncbi:hypothetical protein C9J85_07000 [Haloferax sp. wsp5]|nr:hypothetical protein C9J85_07000 [Haloferax sp. wsp5]